MTRTNINEMHPVTVAGIPAFAMVAHYHHQGPWRGSAHTCPSDHDWYGYTELEFDLYDRKGYRAKWLDEKCRGDVLERVEETILEAMRK